MKIYEIVDESIETKAGLTKAQKDAIGGMIIIHIKCL